MLCSAKSILLLYLGQFHSSFPGVFSGAWVPYFPLRMSSVSSGGLHPSLWYSCRGEEEVICIDLKTQDISNTV